MLGMERERRSAWTAVATAALLLAPVLYVLSTGPAVWMYDRGVIPDHVFIVYAPIEWAADRVPPIEKAMLWYLAMWEGERRVAAPSPTPAAVPPGGYVPNPSSPEGQAGPDDRP
jgi:hypothetical protein